MSSVAALPDSAQRYEDTLSSPCVLEPDNKFPTLDAVYGQTFGSFHMSSVRGSNSSAQETTNDNDVCFATEYIDKFPQELKDMVVEAFYKTLLHPGKVFPEQRSEAGFFFRSGHWYRGAKPLTFNSMNKRWYDKFADLYWSHNTFVIGEGHASYTTGFLQTIPDTTYFKIKKVELDFTTRDLNGGSYLIKPLKIDGTSSAGGANLADIIRFNVELTQEWWLKFSAICSMRLDELKLDFTEAYGADGAFLGLELAMSLEKFTYQRPRRLIVRAPNNKLKRRLLRFLRIL